MSKKYIILTPSIGNMGGSEMYTNNKVHYLMSRGWDVDVFFIKKHEKICIRELEKYKGNCIPDLVYGITYFNKYRRNEIINTICSSINEKDNVVVESHLFHLSFWGELIIKKTGGKNILNFLEESIRPLYVKEAAFLDFKVKRMEVLNASVKSFHRYFGNKYKEEYKNYTHNYMRALCSNVVTDEIMDLSAIPNATNNILSVGRLDKPYVKPMLEEVRKFARNHKGVSLNFIFIGGSEKGEVEEKIKDFYKYENNLNVIILGYMFPIPINLINLADTAIASANSILVTANQGVPTIAIDIHDLMPMGIYRQTTNNLFTRDNEPHTSIELLLEEILINKRYPKTNPQDENHNELVEVFSKQEDFLQISPDDGITYDVLSIYSRMDYVKGQMKWLIHKMIGV